MRDAEAKATGRTAFQRHVCLSELFLSASRWKEAEIRVNPEFTFALVRIT